MELTPAKLRYLITFINIENEHSGKGVRCIDVAVRLGVARPSVCRMLSSFGEENLVYQDNGRFFHSTETGKSIVFQYQQQYQLLYPFFKQTLGLSDFDAQECAMALLASLAAPILSHLCESLPPLSESSSFIPH